MVPGHGLECDGGGNGVSPNRSGLTGTNPASLATGWLGRLETGPVGQIKVWARRVVRLIMFGPSTHFAQQVIELIDILVLHSLVLVPPSWPRGNSSHG